MIFSTVSGHLTAVANDQLGGDNIVHIQQAPHQGGDRHADFVVPVAAVNIGAQGLQDSQDAKGHIADQDLLAQRIAVAEQFPDNGSAHQSHAGRRAHRLPVESTRRG